MEFSHFIGIDVSKLSVNICVRTKENELFYAEVENTVKELKKFVARLKKEDIYGSSTLVCLENTGSYGYNLLEVFYEKGFSLWQEHALNIKNSMRMTRGKNDEVDSSRIAEYCCRFLDKVRFWEPEREVVVELKKLFSVRNTLAKTKKQLSVSKDCSVGYESKKSSKIVSRHLKKVITSIEVEMKKVSICIRALIKQDESLSTLQGLICSVPGVGEVVSWKLLTVTNEFKDFDNSRKFACYSGVVPFDYQSGTSVRGRSRVSNMANKDMKSLLHMSAVSIVAMKRGELYDYYERKVKEGKDKMSVINALRNKIIARVFACVKRNEKYSEVNTNTPV